MPDLDRAIQDARNYLLRRQQPQGYWVDVSIQAYFTLKLAGFRNDEFILRARATLRR